MQLVKALLLCISKHWKQKDKAGKRYVWHPIYVMLQVKGYKEKVVALLHDIIEDTDITVHDLSRLKFEDSIVKSVDIISRKKGQGYFDYLKTVKNDMVARRVKIEDLRHNSDLKRLGKVTRKDIERTLKYKRALDYLST